MTDSEPAATPDNWFWRGPERAGPAIIFDLDGVIADATHRQHFLRDGRRAWDDFFTAAADDPPLEHGVLHGSLISEHYLIVVLTARPFAYMDITKRWLDEQEVRADLLIMRPADDGRSSAEFKRHEVTALREIGIEPVKAFDDDPLIVDMYRSESIPATYVYSGYYER